ncbi:hypothetical protein CHUAL_010377 [Chamberlinius hualienensis]
MILSLKILIVSCVLTSSFINVRAKDSAQNVIKHNNVIVCNVQPWAIHWKGRGYFNVAEFNSTLCTHVVHYRCGLDKSTYKIKSIDPSTDLNVEEGGRDGYRSVANLKLRNHQLKTMVAVGGWEEGTESFSLMASSIRRRQTFVKSLVELLNKYNFEGVVINWKYPTRGGTPMDSLNYVYLLKDLQTAFKNNNWIIAVTLPGSLFFDVEKAYNIPEITKIVDFFIVMTYDYNGYWNKKLGHNSPLYEGKFGFDKTNNANYTMQYYVNMGIDKSKTLFGLPFYGRTYTMDDRRMHYIGDPSQNAPKLGPWTGETGQINYNEICAELKSTWTKVWDNNQLVPYAYKDDYWVSYDNAESITEKILYTIDNNFGGVSIYTIDMDDITGYCHNTTMYLLNTVNKVFEENYLNSSKRHGTIPSQKVDNDGPNLFPSMSTATIITRDIHKNDVSQVNTRIHPLIIAITVLIIMRFVTLVL